MAADDAPVKSGGVPFFPARLSGVTLVATAAFVLLFVFLVRGDLPPGPAFAGLAVVAGAFWAARMLAGRAAGGSEAFDSDALRFDTEMLHGVIAALPDAAIILDRDRRVLAFNGLASAIAPALRQGEPVSLALRAPDVVEAIRQAAATGTPQRVEFSERVPSDRWSECFVTPISQTGHRPRDGSLLMITFHDLTAVRRVEEMRADFVANASHELRTPLAALSGFIETLRGAARDDTAARERFLLIMEAQAKRMARLIDDLLSLSRIELNAHVRPDKPVELMSIVRQVVDALQTLASDREVEVVVKPPAAPLIVPGDRDELIRVFENLIENALKYGGSGKRVEITIGRGQSADGQDEAIVEVRDFGPGISSEHLPRLTERFYRVDVAGSRAQGGTGLGLALVKHVLNRHRGRLTIDSKAGQGAAFTVRLPLTHSGAIDLNH